MGTKTNNLKRDKGKRVESAEDELLEGEESDQTEENDNEKEEKEEGDDLVVESEAEQSIGGKD